MKIKQAVLAGVMLASAALTACASQAYVAYSVPPPPAPMVVGAVGYAPGPGYVWADGFWDLHGSRWAWVRGECAGRRMDTLPGRIRIGNSTGVPGASIADTGDNGVDGRTKLRCGVDSLVRGTRAAG